jgi:hypothetical protein
VGTLDANCAPILHQNLYYHQTDRSEIPYDTRHLGFPSVASTLMFEHMVRSMQTMHLSCIKISTVQTDRTKLPLEPLHLWVPTDFPKWFLRLRCIRRKLCTYLALKLTLPSNGPKRDSIWHTSSTSSVRCVQIDFWAYGTFHANYTPILHQV